MDSFMGRPDEEEIDDRQFFLPLKKQKPQNQLHFDNPLRQSRPSRPNRVTRQNVFGLPGLPGLSRPRQPQFQGGQIGGDFRQQDIDKQKSLEFHDSIIRQPDLIHHNHDEFTSQVEQEFV
eukprot:06561.XXX_121279_121926_1 [CDS] Oithona nana genome sequencing.